MASFPQPPLLRGGLTSQFPGRPYGIDLSHPSARGGKLQSTLAYIAALPKGNNTGATANFSDLSTGKILTVGFGSGNTARQDSLMGPAVETASASGAGYTFTIASSGTPTQLTVAAILRSTGSQVSNGAVIGYDTGNGDGLMFNSSSVWGIQIGGALTFVTSGVTLTSGHWYFLAGSGRSGAWNFVTKDLITGSVRGTTATTAVTFDAMAGSGMLVQSAATPSGGNYVLGVAMINTGTGTMLGLGELLAWANDPWAAWVPRRELETLNWLSAPSAAASFDGGPLQMIFRARQFAGMGRRQIYG